MTHLLDDQQKPLKEITDMIVKNTRNEYVKTLSNTEYFRLLMSEKPDLTIEKLAERINASDSLIKKFLSDDEYLTSKKTLRNLALYGFALSVEEAEAFFVRYGFSFKESPQKGDVLFKTRLSALEPFNDYNINLLSNKSKKDIIVRIVSEFNSLTQSTISELLGVSLRTVQRYFKDLSIVNEGSKKKPNWQIQK